MRLLIADDSDDFRELLQTVFEMEGWEVTAAEDGREALFAYHRALHENRYFDVLLLDVSMPRLNGLAVGVNVRNIEKLGDVPRSIHIYLTGHEDVVEPGDLFENHFADAYIRKPIESHELIEKIKELVKTHEVNEK